MMGLFIWGLLIGRSRVFENPLHYVRVAWRVIAIGAIGFALLYFIQSDISAWNAAKPVQRMAKLLVSSYLSLAQMLIWISGFVLLFHYTPIRKALRLLVPFGRTSLTCYVSQSIIGSVVFYNFGFGLFRQWGQFYSILYGVGFFVLQCAAAHLWLKRFHYGPLEWLWRCGTFLSFKTPLRRRNRPNASIDITPVPVQSGDAA